MTADQLFTAISTFGLATVLLVGLLFGLYRLGTLFIAKVAMPVADAHMAFLKQTSATIENINESLTILNDKTPEICRFEHEKQCNNFLPKDH